MKALLSASSLEPGRTAAGISLRRAADCLQPDSISRLAFVSLLAANGLLLAFLLRLPRRYWTSYMGASIFVNIMVHSYFGFPVFQTLLFTAGNTVEVLVAASFLSTPNANGPDLTRSEERRVGKECSSRW